MRFFIAIAVNMCFLSNAFAESGKMSCVDVSGSLASHISEATILDSLVSIDCGMELNSAVNTILNAGGNKIKTLTAALLINPDYSYTDPTSGFAPTSAGGDSKTESSGDTPSSLKPTTADGGGGESPS